MLTLAALATDLLACDYCQSLPGHRCVTVTGRRATYVHSARTDTARPIWLDGYYDGLAEALSWVRHARDNGHSLAQVEAQLAPWVRDLETR